jgi:AraC-like DNA-binding protein
MQLARKNLLETTRDIGTVGESVGYQSEAAFHKAFKRYFGQGPTSYRKQRKSSRQCRDGSLSLLSETSSNGKNA